MMYFFKHERNGKLQLLISVVAISLAVYLRLSKAEVLITIMCCGFVLSLEMVNTAVENLCNLVQPQYNPTVKTIKDVMAAAVLLASLVSIGIAAFIYISKLK